MACQNARHGMARIILIDDEARLRQTLARFLEQQGHEVVCGGSFADVDAELLPGRFEVLVSDIVMPGFDGMKVLREVVEARGCQEPVILITGEPNLETASAAVRHGAFDYVQKPVTKDRLLEVVARGLRHVKLLRERDQARQAELQLLKNLAALGESASVITHEIRTPITSLRHALRAVAERLGVDDRVLVEELVGNLLRIEKLLGQTLSFAKPLQLRAQPTRLAEVARHAVDEVLRIDRFVGMSVEVHLPDSLVVDVDAQRIGEVFTNLVRNAAEACNGAGHATIAAEVSDRHLTVVVVDDGPGVPAPMREEIFRPFRSSKDYGTGIGLAICRKIVEAHDGRIGVFPAPGGGASFQIELPASKVIER